MYKVYKGFRLLASVHRLSRAKQVAEQERDNKAIYNICQVDIIDGEIKVVQKWTKQIGESNNWFNTSLI